MQRATPVSFNADTQFKNEPHQFPHPPAFSSISSVTAATPAKRITFYKSGDAQFKGVKMAIHKRTFKCFDALLDDLSQKVPLPFGVRTITTPRGIHSIKHLEQLQDGGCYLCSDRRYVKPINIEAVGKRPTVWPHHSHPDNTRRKPSPPEEAPSGHHHHQRHPKRIVLVKNNDPAVRRSILLNRRTAHSLRVFMDEISELMQCRVRKLYTLEGRKIDSIQSLMQCPSVLVCVGREPFRPLLTENLRKLSDERLPGMGTRSRSSICSEGLESKTNVNFGLETKKSIIHPRSDSSNRSTRFSLSSEKSYHGLCVTPGQSACVSTCPYVKEVSGKDDIQKRVLVNKDGSLSVEMKVRFHLFNDETLQWSTEIKKSSTKLNETGSVKESDQRYLQAKAEYSEPDSNSPSETEEGFATKLHKKHLEESLCQNCCNHCQEYDIWRNPMHKDPGACKSPRSSGSSQKIIHKKTSVDSTHTISRSSEEYTEHVVEKASCFQQTLEEGDTRVEYCARSHCCSRSEVSATANRSNSRRSCKDGCESNSKSNCYFSDVRQPDTEVSLTPHYEVTEQRAISAVSNSSKVLQSLKDDQDDDYDDLPPSVSRASNWSQSDHLESDAQSKCIHCFGCQTTTPRSHLSPRPPSKVSNCSVHSLRSPKYKATLTAPEEPDELVTFTDRTECLTSASHASGAKTSSSVASGRRCRAEGRESQASGKSGGQTNALGSTASGVLEICEDEKEQENGSLSGMSASVGLSRRSAKSSVCSWCGECKKTGNPKETEPQNSEKEVASILSTKSTPSEKSTANAQENCETVNNHKSDGETTQEHSETALFKHSNTSAASKNSREATPVSSLSERGEVEENSQEGSVSTMCGNLNTSTSSVTHRKSKTSCSERAGTPRLCSSDDLEVVPSKLLHSQGVHSESAATQGYTLSDNHCGQDTGLVKSAGAMFNKSNPPFEHLPSEETKSSVKACCKLLKTKATQDTSDSDIQCMQESKVTTDERSCDSLSSCSKTSAKSNALSKHSHMQKNDNNDKVSVKSKSKSKERVPSALSVRTNTSNGSCRSHKSSHNVPQTTVTSLLEKTDKCATTELVSKRATSPLSQTSAVSEKSNACSERSMKVTTPDTPASQEMSLDMEDGKDMSQNALTVTSPSPRRSPSPSRTKSINNTEMKQTNSRAPSGMSVNSKVSSQSQRSSKCHCHRPSSSNLRESKSKIQKVDVKDESEESVVSRLSGKSQLSAHSHINNIKSLCNQLDEPLSPTSTASVSLGLAGEHKCDNFDEESTNDMSVTTKEKLEIVNGVDVEKRLKTAESVTSKVSEKSKTSNHITCKSPVQTISRVSAEQVRSTELKKSNSGSQLNENNIRVPSALSLTSSRSKSPSRVSQGSAINSAMKGREGACVVVTDTSQAEMTEKDNASNKISETSTKHVVSGQLTPASDCSKCSERSEKSKKDQSTKETDKRSICSSQCLEINGLDIKSDGQSDKRSVKQNTSRPNSVVMSDVSQNGRSAKQEMQNKNKASIINPDSSDSVLSRALSAADLLREVVSNARPVSRGSKSVASSKNVDKVEKMTDNKSEKRSQKKNKKVSNTSKHNDEEQYSLMPSCLPNASPTEVVNDWLMNNPIDDPVYEMDVEFIENIPQTQGDEEASQKDKSEAPENIIEIEEPHEEDIEDPADQNNIQEENYVNHVEAQSCDNRPQNELSELDPSLQTFTKKEGLEKQCHSSVQVMKVLLGPKLDRCSSLPEVSPVYGRKLSQSAQGLLDCLANLRLIESDSQNEKHPKYNEVMMILQSLWLQEPSEVEPNKQSKKEHQSAEDEFNLQSSSGVDVSSGSTGSVKGSIVQKSETAQGKITPIPELETSKQDKDEAVEENERNSTDAPCEALDASNDLSDPTTPDIAERVKGSPEDKEVDDNHENIVFPPATEEVHSNENKDESDQTLQTSSNKSSGNESYIMKSPDNTSSETPPSVQRAPLAKRISQDPDPVWVLSLLKKLEKQFMLHYADAIAEFKVKWDLDDNEMLNTMITELKEEVHKRIQSSINRELQKIQSRAGRGPRPPGNALSRESTVQTEQRRRHLRVMRNKSITLSRSEEIYTASGTEYSDQRSDDEYCPCDACMKKKMVSRGVQRAEALSLAPVRMEFDLRKILQMKKDPAKPAERKVKDQSTASKTGDKEDNNLEVVHEEVEEVNGNIRSYSNEFEDQGLEEEDNTEANGNNPDVCADHETKDEEEQCDENYGEGQEGERAEGEEGGKEGKDADGEPENIEEMAVDGKEDIEEEEVVESVGEAEHSEIVKEEAEEVNATEEDDEKKDGLDGDIAEVGDVENNDTEEDRENEEIEANMETAEKNETTKIGEETESGEKENASEDQAEETETGESINDERAEEDQPTTDENTGESKSYKDDLSETTEDQKETPNEESPSENDAEGNQAESAEDEAEKGQTSDAGENEDQAKPSRVNVEEEVREDPVNETDKYSSVEEAVPDDTEKDKSAESSGVDSEITRTSVECQPGSVENCTSQTVQAKLNDLQSFIESIESQGDSVVVITKQPPYKESSELHGPENQKDIGNGLIEWQVSPKIGNRGSKRKKLKDNDIVMNDK